MSNNRTTQCVLSVYMIAHTNRHRPATPLIQCFKHYISRYINIVGELQQGVPPICLHPVWLEVASYQRLFCTSLGWRAARSKLATSTFTQIDEFVCIEHQLALWLKYTAHSTARWRMLQYVVCNAGDLYVAIHPHEKMLAPYSPKSLHPRWCAVT